MSGTIKMLLLVLGGLAALLVLTQLGLGLMIVNGKSDPEMQTMILKLITTHQHTGYLTVAMTVIYVIASMAVIARVPARAERRGA